MSSNERFELPHLRARLAAPGVSCNSSGEFDILAISAGNGNGWEFDEAVLRDSLALWEGVDCFIDHSFNQRSIRDLAGVCSQPLWEPDQRGIRLRLKPVGPSAKLLVELGEQMLSASAARPTVGFSADLWFSAQGQQVVKIHKVESVDLVFEPARGGTFLAYTGLAEEGTVLEEKQMNNSETIQKEGAAPSEANEELRVQMCQSLLDLSLAAARLPQPVNERIRRQFEGHSFSAEALKTAIEDNRQLVSDLTAGAVVQGPGRIHGMNDTRDQLQAAVDQLFGVPAEASLPGVRPHRLSGIRELYLSLTGDYDLHGGYHPERAQLATTADFSGLVKNAMNKVVANRWAELGRAGYNWWEKVAQVEHFESLQSITGTLVGTVGDLPTVAEGAEYGELAVGDSPETASFTKYGGYIPLTMELIDRDETRKLRAYPLELASAGLRKISKLVAAVFTDNSGSGPTLADGGALFNASAVSGAGGHANLLTTALSASQWDVVSTAVYNQPMLVKNSTGLYGSGPKMGVNPRYLLVPRALQLAGMKILYPTLENAASIYSENQQRGQPGDVITVPEWTDATDWAAVCDPRIVPAIFIGERFGIMPEIYIAGDELSPAVFMNDEHRLKVRHFLAAWVNDFRPLHKSNVAG